MLRLADEIHVWWIDLAQRWQTATHDAAVLCESESRRADALRVPQAREAFVTTRSVLRMLLAAYTGRPARSIRMAYGHAGKPSMAGADLHFNVSHSAGIAVVAVTGCGPVGVDVEWHDPRIEPIQIAERFFAPAEIRVLRTLPEGQLAAGFYACWTRKEAYIKALGDGLSHDLASFAVSLAPGAQARLLGAPAASWEMTSLSPAAGYSAALVAPRMSTSARVREFRWLGPPSGGGAGPGYSDRASGSDHDAFMPVAPGPGR